MANKSTTPGGITDLAAQEAAVLAKLTNDWQDQSAIGGTSAALVALINAGKVDMQVSPPKYGTTKAGVTVLLHLGVNQYRLHQGAV